MQLYCVAPLQQPICGHLTSLPFSGIITTLDKQTKENKMKTVIWQVRRSGVTWKASFKTRKEAREHLKKSWQFKSASDSYIVKITTERVS
jgi:hypothetical protein